MRIVNMRSTHQPLLVTATGSMPHARDAREGQAVPRVPSAERLSQWAVASELEFGSSSFGLRDIICREPPSAMEREKLAVGVCIPAKASARSVPLFVTRLSAMLNVGAPAEK